MATAPEPEVQAFFDQYNEAFASIDGNRIAALYHVPTVTVRALSGAARIAKHRGIDAFGAFGEAVVRSADDRAIPIQVDGDHISDELEARFSVAAGALTVVA